LHRLHLILIVEAIVLTSIANKNTNNRLFPLATGKKIWHFIGVFHILVFRIKTICFLFFYQFSFSVFCCFLYVDAKLHVRCFIFFSKKNILIKNTSSLKEKIDGVSELRIIKKHQQASLNLIFVLYGSL